ncbi:MAG: AraC family transcriptional regulator [Chryseosolibacter sp.]
MKEKAATKKNEAPVFKLQAFGEKPTWTDFYIQNLKAHIKDHSFVNKPHKHDFYLIMYVTKGSGVHSIDFVDYEVEPNRMFLMTPGQVHTWELSDETEGFIIFFTRDFYQLRLTDNNLLDFPFFHSLVASPLIHIAEQEVVRFTLKQMKLEYERSGQPDLRLIRAYLDLMLLEVAKYYDVSKTVQTQASIYKLRKLEQLIDANFRTLKQASDYAELMNLAPTYLNSICKESLGKTLTELIHDRLLLEAKRMFAYSDLNINEVAARLSFSDVSYFIRWFKKQTAQTPEEFRQRILRH